MESPQDPGGEYTLLFAANPIPMWVFDRETLRFLEVNQAAVAKYGYSREEFLGMTIADIRPPEDVPGLAADMTALMAAGLGGPAVRRHRRKDGTPLTVQITAQDIIFRKRRARLVVAQDVSERERLAAELQKEHRFLQSILDGMPEVVFVKDREHRFTLVNAAWERFTGVPRNEATGKTSHDLFPVDVADGMRRADVGTFDADARTETEQTLASDGGPRTYLTSRFPLRDEEGCVEGLVGLAIDITERQAAQERLREYERVVEGLEEMIVVVDRDYRYLLANRAYLEYRGQATDEVLGRLVPEGPDREVFERDVKKRLDECLEGKVVRYALRYDHPDLGQRDLAISNFPIAGPAGVDRVACVFQDITERKRAEEALDRARDDRRRAEERAQAEREHSRRDADRLAAIVQSSSDAIYAKSLDGTIVAWNASAELLFGYAQAEALGRSALILVPPEAESELAEILATISAGERIDHQETTRVRKDGSLVFVSLSESPLRDAGGRVVGVSAIARDISRQRHAERALLESQKKLRAFVDSDVVGILVSDWSGGLEANDEFLRMTGHSREDLRAGRVRWAEITAPEFRHLDDAAQAEALARGACTPYEKQFVRKDGKRVWVLVGYALLDRDQDRSVGFVLDIDARKHAEDELRKSEERFAKVFQSNLIAIGMSEMATGRLIDVNNRCAEFFGYERAEMIGRTVFELALFANPADREWLVATSAAGSASRMEVAFRRKSGELRHAMVSMETMTLAGMAEPLNIVVIVDMTERQRLESQLLQAQKMEAIGRLAGGVAHDFNNSLGVILGYTELLLRQASDAHRGKLEQILKATLHASGLTRQLLAFSRKQIVDPKVLDLNVLVLDLEKMLGRLIGEDIDLAIVSGADLGQVTADPGQLEQVVLNLCVNARDAMPDGGLLRIETANAELDAGDAARHEPMAPGRYVMLAVSDTGSGVEKEILSKIFDPFFTTKEVGKGTGLGLAMVYGVVKQAGGHVWVDSEVGQGTTFKIYLPRIDEPARTPAAPEAPMPSKGWETILLVEDETSLRAIAREILEEHGYRVIEATGPGEAIEIARHHPGPIHLVITDVVMPGMNGRVMAELLVAGLPDLRVLYMSGYTDDVIAHSGVLDSGTLLLEKPFTVVGLLERVRVALGQPGAGKEA